MVYEYKDLIYVEIGDRNTGKTYRLIENAANYILNTKQPIGIVSTRAEFFQFLEDRISSKAANDFVDYNCFGNEPDYYKESLFQKTRYEIKRNCIFRLKSMMDSIDHKMRIYADEFVHIPNIDEILYIRENVYFTSSEEGLEHIKDSYFFKKIENFPSWRRQKFIETLLKENT